MKIAELMANKLEKLFQEASLENIKADTYKDLCGALHVTKMYYDIDLGGDDRYRNQRTGKLVFEATPVDDKLVLYDSGMPGGLKKCYNFYYDGNEYVHAYIEFEKAVKEDDIDQELCAFMANVIYIIISRQNMRKMLDYAETSDVLTGIPNIAMVQRKYYTVLQHSRPQDYAVRISQVNVGTFFSNSKIYLLKRKSSVRFAAGSSLLLPYRKGSAYLSLICLMVIISGISN